MEELSTLEHIERALHILQQMRESLLSQNHLIENLTIDKLPANVRLYERLRSLNTTLDIDRQLVIQRLRLAATDI